jgi:hypothetical protein|tara:strand:+ start:685 stop:1131 length:447 start_codon:yes stop_codon:yes gene_type:complete
MLEIIIGCLFPMFLTPDLLSDYKECREVKNQVQYVEQWHSLISTYFKPEDVIQGMTIVYCESKGKETAVGRNTNGTTDVGLWQFNDNTWAWLKPKLGIINDRKNPITSTKIAAWLVYNDGWHHWNSSKHCWKGHNNELLEVNLNENTN